MSSSVGVNDKAEWPKGVLLQVEVSPEGTWRGSVAASSNILS